MIRATIAPIAFFATDVAISAGIARNIMQECQKCATNSHEPGTKFYATVLYDAIWKRVLGPFETHQAAIDAVPEARETVRCILGHLPEYPFLAYGTIGVRP